MSSLRQSILEKRQSLHPNEIQKMSSEIFSKFQTRASKMKWKNLRVALYKSMRGEPDLSFFEEYFKNNSAKILYPRVKNRDTKTLEFVEVLPDSKKIIWEKGPYGIEEPHSDLPATPPDKIDLILVPGVVFGKNGERIGMGAGYFDRFLPLTTAIRLAVCFDLQLKENIPQNPWDQKVDWILTEKSEYISPVGESRLRKFE